MKIIIKKSSLPTYWYAREIGKEYELDEGPVYDKLLDEYVYWPIGGKGCVFKDDCEVIQDEPGQDNRTP